MEDILIPIFGIVGVFGMPVFIIWIVYYFSSRSEKQFHQTLQELIKSGQELSPDILAGIPGYKKGNGERNDIRTGTITAGVGIGIALFGGIGVEEEALIGIGLLVFSIGLGILGYGVYNRNKKVDDNS
ncbi:MAG: DUF6249 domain-containing protein [SAR86 cluster bacterium]|jgi:hypothetical protein|nr:DUF6249 domain-containing protein [SAR86 cluster bacterium]